jgi:hypothetical protein
MSLNPSGIVPSSPGLDCMGSGAQSYPGSRRIGPSTPDGVVPAFRQPAPPCAEKSPVWTLNPQPRRGGMIIAQGKRDTSAALGKRRQKEKSPSPL